MEDRDFFFGSRDYSVENGVDLTPCFKNATFSSNIQILVSIDLSPSSRSCSLHQCQYRRHSKEFQPGKLHWSRVFVISLTRTRGYDTYNGEACDDILAS
jgi:hypothetical protein